MEDSKLIPAAYLMLWLGIAIVYAVQGMLSLAVGTTVCAVVVNEFSCRSEVKDWKEKKREAPKITAAKSEWLERNAGLYFDGIFLLPGYYQLSTAIPTKTRTVPPRGGGVAERNSLLAAKKYFGGIVTEKNGRAWFDDRRSPLVPVLRDEEGKTWAVPGDEQSEKHFPRRLPA